MMIEMVLAGASKKDLTIKLKDSKAVKREAAVLNVVETGEDYKSTIASLIILTL